MCENLDDSVVCEKCYKFTVAKFFSKFGYCRKDTLLVYFRSADGLRECEVSWKWGTLLDICSDDPLEYYPDSGKVSLPLLYVDFVNY